VPRSIMCTGGEIDLLANAEEGVYLAVRRGGTRVKTAASRRLGPLLKMAAGKGGDYSPAIF